MLLVIKYNHLTGNYEKMTLVDKFSRHNWLFNMYSENSKYDTVSVTFEGLFRIHCFMFKHE